MTPWPMKPGSRRSRRCARPCASRCKLITPGLLDKLSQDHIFDVPMGMVDMEFESIWTQFEAERKRAQDAGTYEPEEGKTDDDFKTEYRDISIRRVRLGLLLAEIGKSNNIQV